MLIYGWFNNLQFHHWDKILHTRHLKEERFILAHGYTEFSQWSSDSVAEISQRKGMVKQCSSLHDSQKTEQKNSAREEGAMDQKYHLVTLTWSTHLLGGPHAKVESPA